MDGTHTNQSKASPENEAAVEEELQELRAQVKAQQETIEAFTQQFESFLEIQAGQPAPTTQSQSSSERTARDYLTRGEITNAVVSEYAENNMCPIVKLHGIVTFINDAKIGTDVEVGDRVKIMIEDFTDTTAQARLLSTSSVDE